MPNPLFYIADVFAEEKYAGNQLAVFRHTAALSTEQMQKIANEMHFSETTFIVSEVERNGGYDVRIFTSHMELPFAGHPTLGTANIIRNEIIAKPVERVALNLQVGQIPVFFENDLAWMRQIQPCFGRTLGTEAVAAALGLESADLDKRFPIMEVSTGVYTLIAALNSLPAIKRAQVDLRQFSALVKNLQAKTILIFTSETESPDNNLHVRFFADELGVAEDPATGSANGCLAAWLVKNRYFKSPQIDVRVEQGSEIMRPSRLYLKARENPAGIDIYVGGKVFVSARGEFI